MLKNENVPFERPSKKLGSKMVGPFEIIKKVGDRAYYLKLPFGWKIHPTFNISMLEPYRMSDINQRPRAPTPVDQDEFYVRCINKVKFDGQRKKLVYFVEWEGNPVEEGIWLPEEELLVEGEPIFALEEYRQRFPLAEQETLMKKTSLK